MFTNQSKDPVPNDLWHRIDETLERQEQTSIWNLFKSPLLLKGCTVMAVCFVVIGSVYFNQRYTSQQVNDYLAELVMTDIVDMDMVDYDDDIYFGTF